MYVRLSVCLSEHVCHFMCTCVLDRGKTSLLFFQCHWSCVLRQIFSLDWNLPLSLGQAGQWAPFSTFLSSTGVTSVGHYPLFCIHGIWGLDSGYHGYMTVCNWVSYFPSPRLVYHIQCSLSSLLHYTLWIFTLHSYNSSYTTSYSFLIGELWDCQQVLLRKYWIFYFPFRSLLRLKSGGNYWCVLRDMILSYLASLSEKVTAGLEDNKGLTHSDKKQ